ncbi:MAG TPA: GNAT family N-acetyltransferase [Thermoanaerobaculia bacterium]|nr:GNAT family N-acetyltransferase [Thermoanaerobaculia bacterium]
MSDLRIRPMRNDDWPALAAIYEAGLATGQASFETTVPEWEAWSASHHQHCRLVAESGRGIVGWAALSPVSSRAVYAGVAEVSVYVAERERGVGGALLDAIIAASEQSGIWTLQSATFPENEASVRLQLSRGFRIVGRRERIGRHRGVWRDTVILERRSPLVG